MDVLWSTNTVRGIKQIQLLSHRLLNLLNTIIHCPGLLDWEHGDNLWRCSFNAIHVVTTSISISVEVSQLRPNDTPHYKSSLSSSEARRDVSDQIDSRWHDMTSKEKSNQIKSNRVVSSPEDCVCVYLNILFPRSVCPPSTELAYELLLSTVLY